MFYSRSAAVIGCLLFAGCFKSSDGGGAEVPQVDPQELAAYRSQWVLAERPADAQGIRDVREIWEEDSDADVPEAQQEAGGDSPALPTSLPVVLVGRIGGAEYLKSEPDTSYPWEPGHAAFMIADLTLDGKKHSHKGSACPFCAKEAKDGSAMVRFLGDNGQPVPIDARTLFELAGGEKVVVRGTASHKLGQLFVDADGIYVE